MGEIQIKVQIAQLTDMQEAHPEIKENLQRIINHLKGSLRSAKKITVSAQPIMDDPY